MFEHLYVCFITYDNLFIVEIPSYIQFSDGWTSDYLEISKNLCRDMRLYNDFLSSEEETSIFEEIEPYLKRMRYEFDHWDDVI